MARTNEIVAYANEDVGFYPTPSELANKMLANIDWKLTRTFLEPSAGKGNIVDAIMRAGYENRGGRYGRSDVEIDCVEIDSDLRSILSFQFCGGRFRELQSQLDSFRSIAYSERTEQIKQEYDHLEKETSVLREASVRIVADDFLKFKTYKQYDAIIMNPPFDKGDLHLLHAIEIQKNGGAIVCLLNAETIRNPYTNTRKLLKTKLEKYGAKIQFIKNAFSTAERETDVEIALIEINIPRKEQASFIFEGLKKAQEKKREKPDESTEITPGDFIERIIEQFNFEVEGTLRLIREYEAIKPYMLVTFDEDQKDRGSILTLSLAKDSHNYHQIVDINEYLKIVRLKYWRALFKNKEFTGALTSNLYEKYSNIVEGMGEYDFTLYNIQVFREKMMSELTKGLEDTILALFDKLTEQHSWYPECAGNIHYFNGWATNKAHMINMKKVIIPVYGAFADPWHPSTLNEWTVINVMSDIEKVFNYLDTEQIGGPDLAEQINMYSKSGITKKIPLKFFWVTFYKKGTCHIEWRVPELVEKLNIYGCQRKNWLPPCYGKKHYADMTDEEKTVIDEFQGKEEYAKVMARSSYYLVESETGGARLLLGSGGTEDA